MCPSPFQDANTDTEFSNKSILKFFQWMNHRQLNRKILKSRKQLSQIVNGHHVLHIYQDFHVLCNDYMKSENKMKFLSVKLFWKMQRFPYFRINYEIQTVKKIIRLIYCLCSWKEENYLLNVTSRLSFHNEMSLHAYDTNDLCVCVLSLSE